MKPPAMVHRPGCPDTSKARTLCRCGQNVGCSACGWGWAVYPCKCRRDDAAREREDVQATREMGV